MPLKLTELKNGVLKWMARKVIEDRTKWKEDNITCGHQKERLSSYFYFSKS
jgi:hypothetical protein